jgi:hypothetical protein
MTEDGKKIYVVYEGNGNANYANILQTGLSSLEESVCVYSTEKLNIPFKNSVPKKYRIYNTKKIQEFSFNLSELVTYEAEALYTSFLLSNQSESLRIPSQSYQSFMAMKTIAFIEGNSNDCYTNVWQSWF